MERYSREPAGDLLDLLRIIGEHGGTDCTGSCHHRRAGEFHCHAIGPMLHCSSSGVRTRVLRLLEAGFLERRRIERGSSFPLTRFVLTDKGKQALGLDAGD